MIGRNDDYMKGGFERMKMAIKNYVAQARKYELDMELIIVDWNPPENKPLLKDVITIPDDLGKLVVRFIVVPPEIHKSFKASEKINIINVAAYNAGIRRARGEFIMATNADILFSDELAHFIASKNLQKNCFYRAFRHDIDRNILNITSYEAWMDFCKHHVVKAFMENVHTTHPKGFEKHPVLQTDCGGDFILFSKECWHAIHGYPQTNNLGLASDVLLCYVAYLAGLKETVLKKPRLVYHIDHDSRWRGLSESKLSQMLRNNVYNHLNSASRLRILMKSINMLKRKTWDVLVDTGYEIVGPWLERLSPPGSWDFNTRYLSVQYKKILYQMLSGKRSHVYNNEHWGFPKENFKEFVIHGNTN